MKRLSKTMVIIPQSQTCISDGVGASESLEKIMSSKMPGGPGEPVSGRLMVSH